MNRPTRWTVYAALLVLYALHNDLWFWYDSRIVLGLPVGLTYHIFYNLAAAGLMFLLVRYAWPSHLEVVDEPAAEEAQQAASPENPDIAAQRTDAAEDAGGQP